MPPRLRLQLAVEELPLKVPFRISGYTFTQIPALVAQLWDAERIGRGEAEGVYYFDDTPARMAVDIESRRAEIEAGITRDELRELLPIGGARNALDCALWELEAKRAGQPVWKLAGIEQAVPLTTMFTLGADHPATIATAATARADATALKLKLSGELELDIERVRAVRGARRTSGWVSTRTRAIHSIHSNASCPCSCKRVYSCSSSHWRAAAKRISTLSIARFRSPPMKAVKGSPTSKVCSACSMS